MMNINTHQVFMLFILIIGSSLLVPTHGDLIYYSPPAPEPGLSGGVLPPMWAPSMAPAPSPYSEGPEAQPPSTAAGKVFPPENMYCGKPNSKCNGKKIECPKECPSFKPADPKAKACTIDCDSPKCESYCKNRTANCEGPGSACGDPRFVGGDGIVFYFHGKTNQHFSLVSDSNIQINARFIGRRPEGRKRDNTWIQALGLMFSTHSFTLAAKKVADWDKNVDQLLFTYDNMPISINEGHLSSWSAPNSPLLVERTANTNSITVTLPGVVEISASVVPITKEDDRIHNYQIPYSEDCFAHLEVQFRFFDLSERVEGVLGQTYRPEFQSPVKRGVAMPIMGGEDKYMTSSLVSSDCNYCIFSSSAAAAVTANPLVLDPSNSMECTSKMSNGRGVVCRR
ncbi:Root cap [Macleaya cordata]|uniref:Root cap n=1 Tax=Macleaya cordata TaxID=56857 RepID=A0A200QJX2_MACCD|nr:Root cap [Macleaya cordata]